MPRQISEARTCKEMIDPQLEQARLHSWMVVLARVESLRGRMGESTRQVEGLFDALLAQTMDNGQWTVDDGQTTVNGLWSMVCFVGVAARVESLRGGWASPRRRWRGCLRVCWRRRFREKYRPRIFHEYSNGWRDIRAFVVPFVDGCLCVGRVAAGVEGLFESLLAQSFDGE